MSSVAIVCIVFGSFIVISRGLIVVAPATTLRWVKDMISTETRVQTLGLYVLVLPALMIWAGASEDTLLANVLLIFGLFFRHRIRRPRRAGAIPGSGDQRSIAGQHS